MGYDVAVTRFFHLNAVVKWATTPEDIGLIDGGRINVVSFGWLFTVADLGYFDQWGEPPSLGRGVYSWDAVRAERRKANGLACVSRCRIIVGQEDKYAAQLIGTHPNDYDGREYLEEIVLVQVGIISRSRHRARVCFFQQMDEHNSSCP